MSSKTQCSNEVLPKKKKHNVFVLGVDGKPLTPTTKAKARKLLKGGAAKKIWSKFDTFGIQLLEETRKNVLSATLGSDPGGKYEGHSVICGNENVLSVKSNLPNKEKISEKMTDRLFNRKSRKSRKRNRPQRYNNRKRVKNWISPSQRVIVCSRLKILNELYKIYPIKTAGVENVGFNHKKYKWGKHFTTAEVGKTILREWFKDREIILKEYEGWETKQIREKLGYKKSSSKKADTFNAHCSDSLALAVEAGGHGYVEPGEFIVVDDTYRYVRRKLHHKNFKKGGIKEEYSRGSVNGIGKGVLIGTTRGRTGFLCGREIKTNRIKYYSGYKKTRQSCKEIAWFSRRFKVLKHSQGGQKT